ncbi:MAG TPA: hypothetical protein ENL07_04610 [Chlorobaculum parvum]|uniref:Uncharacterized protein n=1 Tax=Chlorobaculum parvum TaxID=274539 RepID=A0A7C5DGB7_9CHLB|nr:hypothetical protein [Chlorobaculum parvum]
MSSAIPRLRPHGRRTALLRRVGMAIVGVVLCYGLQGCSGKPDDQKAATPEVPEDHRLTAPIDPHTSAKDMPSWLDLYREKRLENISSVDHVVIVRFESLGDRDEVYSYYADKFGNEESFSSFRDSRDIISFIKEGYGVKITLINPSKNLWSLEYHQQAI